MPDDLAKTEEPETTLGDFLKENHVLLSTLGIFTALTVFSGQLHQKWAAYALSFLFLAAMILTLSEIWKKLPKRVDYRLSMMKYLLIVAIGVLVLYWFLEYQPFLGPLLVLPLMFVLSWLLVIPFRFLTKKIENSIVRRLVVTVLAIGIGLVSLPLATVLAMPINVGLLQIATFLKMFG